MFASVAPLIGLHLTHGSTGNFDSGASSELYFVANIKSDSQGEQFFQVGNRLIVREN